MVPHLVGGFSAARGVLRVIFSLWVKVELAMPPLHRSFLVFGSNSSFRVKVKSSVVFGSVGVIFSFRFEVEFASFTLVIGCSRTPRLRLFGRRLQL